MRESQILSLRALRSRCRALSHLVAEDYRPFFAGNLKLFFWLPSSPPKVPAPVSVTNTATALMALAQTERLASVLSPTDENAAHTAILDQLRLLISTPWCSSKLPQNNAFTAALVVRTAGLLLRNGIVQKSTIDSMTRSEDDTEAVTGSAISDEARQFHGKTLNVIATQLLERAPASLKVMEYAPTPPIAYWLVSGAIDLGVSPTLNLWKPITEWLIGQFCHQVSLLTADHPALMDPIALAMAGAACKKIDTYLPELRRNFSSFPTKEELTASVRLFMRTQNTAGSWGKYFPLFHYPTAGANHCWHVEVLEALLSEIPDLLDDRQLLEHFERAVQWLERNRLQWQQGKVTFRGWNSGGQLETLARGEPEAWATGVAHMMLSTLANRLSLSIRHRVLRARRTTTPLHRDDTKWKSVLDCRVPIQGSDGRNSLKDCIQTFMIDPILKNDSAVGSWRLPKQSKRSVLLFGPPGTGKTRTARAIAHAIGWDFVEILPSDFLDKGLEGVYSAANAIFEDLQDLERAVVFFDEMDALLQRRVGEDGKPILTVQQQFMTTSMLPHLADLYDAGKVLFLFATNYRQTFDKAITRHGRFEMLLFVGPPDWELKTKSIAQFAKLENKSSAAAVGDTLLKWVPLEDALADGLTRATFGETKGFFRQLCKGNSLDTAIDKKIATIDSFRKLVEEWSQTRFSLLVEPDLKSQYESEFKMSEVRW